MSRGEARRVSRVGRLVLAVAAAGVLPATVATCDRTSENSGNFYLTSSNDHLLENVLDFLDGGDDDDD